MMCEIVIPILLILVGLSLTKIKFLKNPKVIDFDRTIYDDNYKINKILEGGVDITSDLLSEFDNKDKTTIWD